jgi:hypothetical protein
LLVKRVKIFAAALQYHAHLLRVLGEKPGLVTTKTSGLSTEHWGKIRGFLEKTAILLHIECKRGDQRTK